MRPRATVSTLSTAVLTALLLASAAAALPLKMPPVPELTLAPGTPVRPLAAALHLPADVRQSVHELRTSPFDKVSFAIGPFTAELFEKNLGKAFSKVGKAESRSVPAGFDFVVEVGIVQLEAVVPMPAYNPYTASMVYRVEVFGRDGEKLFTQTASGAGQSGKGMLSGFKARSLAAESAAGAMADAARQILEGLAAAPEFEAPAAAQAPASTPAAAPAPTPAPDSTPAPVPDSTPVSPTPPTPPLA
jgi:hypothetical protein